MEKPRIYNDVETITFAFKELEIVATRTKFTVIWRGEQVRTYPVKDKNEAINQRFGMGVFIHELLTKFSDSLEKSK